MVMGKCPVRLLLTESGRGTRSALSDQLSGVTFGNRWYPPPEGRSALSHTESQNSNCSHTTHYVVEFSLPKKLDGRRENCD